MSALKIAAIVAAAGSGTRFAEGGKTFYPLRGKPVLLWTLESLEAADEIAEIIPVVKRDQADRALRMIEEGGLKKAGRIAIGGLERQDSVWNALRLLSPDTDIVLVHDGARPFATPGFIKGLIASLEGFDGVAPGLKPRDTIKEVSEEGLVMSTLNREKLVAVQTPQVFRFGVLFDAYRKAMASGIYSTDDSALVEAAGGRVKVVPGLERNIKITTPEDIILAEGFLA
jgi:2-C-methyl-D-erythritol 4-phosphate cytidylyltransferase